MSDSAESGAQKAAESADSTNPDRELSVRPYDAVWATRWNDFVRASKNGTFLFDRMYMEYHSDRFRDASLIVEYKGRICALLPANCAGDVVTSHGGLTYGGFIVASDMTTARMLDTMTMVLTHLRSRGVKTLVYKSIPHIYHRAPAEEDLYALYRHGATLVRRDVLSVISTNRSIRYEERRRRGVKRAVQANITVLETTDFESYVAIVEANLSERHDTKPVHTAAELTLLRDRFPAEIRLFGAFREGAMVGGVLMYESVQVAHAQYIASSPDGRDMGCLDLLFDTLLQSVYRDKPFFDFGISTEDAGLRLNSGLVAQKEGFGARAVVHDHYRLDLDRIG